MKKVDTNRYDWIKIVKKLSVKFFSKCNFCFYHILPLASSIILRPLSNCGLMNAKIELLKLFTEMENLILYEIPRDLSEMTKKKKSIFSFWINILRFSFFAIYQSNFCVIQSKLIFTVFCDGVPGSMWNADIFGKKNKGGILMWNNIFLITNWNNTYQRIAFIKTVI